MRDLHRYSHSKVVLLVKDKNDVVCPKCVILVAVGETHEGPQKRLSRNEVAGCLSVIMRRCRYSKS